MRFSNLLLGPLLLYENRVFNNSVSDVRLTFMPTTTTTQMMLRFIAEWKNMNFHEYIRTNDCQCLCTRYNK